MLITRFGLQGTAADSQQGRRAGGGGRKEKTTPSETPFDPQFGEQAARQVCLRWQHSLRVDSAFTRDTGSAEEEVNTPFNAHSRRNLHPLFLFFSFFPDNVRPPCELLPTLALRTHTHTRYRFCVTAADGCLRQSN